MINIPQPQTSGLATTYSSNGSISENQQLKQDVFIQISSEFTSAIIEYMLTKRISFHLSYNQPHLETKSSEVEVPLNNLLNKRQRENHDNISVFQEESVVSIDSQENTLTSNDVAIIEKIYKKYLEIEIQKTPPQEAQIAAEFGIALRKFKNTFKEIYGKPFYQIYMDKRMEYAAKLLKRGYKAVEVSKRIGYGEKSCIKFNKMFQKHFGMTPKRYQMSHLNRIDKR